MSNFEVTLGRIQEIQRYFGSETPAASAGPGGNASFDSVLSQVQGSVPDENSPLRKELEQVIQRQAQTQGVDPSLVKAVVQAESGFNPKAVSPVGAQGLMQLMPGTAQGLGVQDSFNPTENIKGGSKYLKGLLDKYQSVPLALAAYNAGPGAVDRYGGIPPYKETQSYVKRVLNFQQHFSELHEAGGGS